MPEPTDYSVAATPAREDIANALTILVAGARTFHKLPPRGGTWYDDADVDTIRRLLTRALATLEHR